jgi:hypothetical protein
VQYLGATPVLSVRAGKLEVGQAIWHEKQRRWFWMLHVGDVANGYADDVRGAVAAIERAWRAQMR